MRGLLRRTVIVAGVMVLGAAAGVANATGTAAAGTRLAAGRDGSGDTWGTAIEVPGSAALNQGGSAEITSVSCATAQNCSAGGHYTDSSHHTMPFVVTQAHGTWGNAIEVPGIAALDHGPYAGITSVSCAVSGNCGAGGYYRDSSGRYQAFVVRQADGTWGKAIEVPGTAALNQATHGEAMITSVSCAAAGTCSAGGYYQDSSNHFQPFVVSEAGGTWGTAIEVPGIAALNRGGDARISSVSCAAAGSCSAGGYYTESSGHQQVFVVSQAGGTWGTAIEVPGTAALNRGGRASISSVSCAAAGSCSAAGQYNTDSTGIGQVFVVSQAGGTWGRAIEVPGTAALNRDGYDNIASVSCTAAGTCSAGGLYTDSSGHRQAFVVSQVGGTWGTAMEVPGTAALNQGGDAYITSVSCAAAGNCSAGGRYRGEFGGQAFVVSQAHGTWGTAIEVPGTAALNQGRGGGIASVSCASAGHCSAGGRYTDSSYHSQVFVVSEK